MNNFMIFQLSNKLNNTFKPKIIQKNSKIFFKKYGKKEFYIPNGYSSQDYDNANKLMQNPFIEKVNFFLMNLFYKYFDKNYKNTASFINYFLKNAYLKEHIDLHHDMAMIYYPIYKKEFGRLYIIESNSKKKIYLPLTSGTIIIFPSNIIHGSEKTTEEGRVVFVNFFKKVKNASNNI